MKKQLSQEDKFLAAKANAQAIKDDILDPEEAQFVDGGPVDDGPQTLNALIRGQETLEQVTDFCGRVRARYCQYLLLQSGSGVVI